MTDPRLEAAATVALSVRQDMRAGATIVALAEALELLIAVVRDMAALAPVVPLHSRIVPEPRVLPGETLGDYWNRTGEASSEWARKHIVPLTDGEES